MSIDIFKTILIYFVQSKIEELNLGYKHIIHNQQ